MAIQTHTGVGAKPEFRAKEESQAVAEVSVKLSSIALVLSTISSATSFGFMGLALVPSEYKDLESWTGWAIYALIFTIAGYVAHAIDFHGVQKYGRHALGELIAILSRKFYSSIMRKLYTLLSLSVFAICFAVSFFTSRDGSKMVAGFAQIETNVTEYSTAKIEKAQSLKAKALKPFETRLAEAKQRMEAEVLKAREQYNGVEYKDRAEAKVRKQFEQKGGLVYNAQKALEEQEAHLQEQDKMLLEAMISDQIRQVQSTKAKAEGVMTLLETLGIYPLFIAIILLGIDAVYRVSSQIKDNDGLGLWDWLTGVFGGMRGK